METHSNPSQNSVKTAVLIIGHAPVNRAIARHAPYYKLSGADLFGVCDLDDGTKWPAGFEVISFPRIENPRQMKMLRFFEALSWCEMMGLKSGYDQFVVMEYDAIFVRPMPKMNSDIMATWAGNRSQGFHGSSYYHCPWMFTREGLRHFMSKANIMMQCGLDEGGFIDRFLGLYSDLYTKPPTLGLIASAPNYSQNSIDRPEYVAAARAAIARPDCFAIHGIKTDEMLSDVLQDRKL